MVRLEKKIEKTETYLFDIKLAAIHNVGETLLLALRVMWILPFLQLYASHIYKNHDRN